MGKVYEPGNGYSNLSFMWVSDAEVEACMLTATNEWGVLRLYDTPARSIGMALKLRHWQPLPVQRWR